MNKYYPGHVWAGLGAAYAGILVAVWLFTTLMSLTVVLVGVGTYYALGPVFKPAIEKQTARRIAVRDFKARLEQQKRSADVAVYRLMTHLTPADERWLAERHHYVIPKEVARLRAGLPAHKYPEADRYGQYPIPVRNRLDLAKKAEKSKEEFFGTNLAEGSDSLPQHSTTTFHVEMPRDLQKAAQDIANAVAVKALTVAEDIKAKDSMVPVEGDLVDPPHRARGSR